MFEKEKGPLLDRLSPSFNLGPGIDAQTHLWENDSKKKVCRMFACSHLRISITRNGNQLRTTSRSFWIFQNFYPPTSKRGKSISSSVIMGSPRSAINTLRM